VSKLKHKLKIISLGGVDEIGKNMTAIEYGNDIIVIDCGSMFPNEDLYGIDLVIPDVTYLEKNIDKLRAFIITHGHEDHIGAIPYVFQKINAPIYCTRLTQALIQNKLKEYNMPNKIKMNCIQPKDTLNIGCFSIEFIKTNHSIAGAVALAIHTPVGTVIHTGDFKVESKHTKGSAVFIYIYDIELESYSGLPAGNYTGTVVYSERSAIALEITNTKKAEGR